MKTFLIRALKWNKSDIFFFVKKRGYISTFRSAAMAVMFMVLAHMVFDHKILIFNHLVFLREALWVPSCLKVEKQTWPVFRVVSS